MTGAILAARIAASGTTKPNGFLDSNGQPFINSDGSVDTSTLPNGVQNGTYGLLVNTGGVPASNSLADSVRAKSEYLTVGSSSVAEGFALIGDNAGLRTGPPVNGRPGSTQVTFNVQSFTTTTVGGGSRPRVAIVPTDRSAGDAGTASDSDGDSADFKLQRDRAESGADDD